MEGDYYHGSLTPLDLRFDNLVLMPVSSFQNLAQPASVIPGRLIRSLRTQYEEGSGKGIKGMEVVIDDADSEKHVGPPSPIFFYRSYWVSCFVCLHYKICEWS